MKAHHIIAALLVSMNGAWSFGCAGSNPEHEDIGEAQQALSCSNGTTPVATTGGYCRYTLTGNNAAGDTVAGTTCENDRVVCIFKCDPTNTGGTYIDGTCPSGSSAVGSCPKLDLGASITGRVQTDVMCVDGQTTNFAWQQRICKALLPAHDGDAIDNECNKAVIAYVAWKQGNVEFPTNGICCSKTDGGAPTTSTTSATSTTSSTSSGSSTGGGGGAPSPASTM